MYFVVFSELGVMLSGIAFPQIYIVFDPNIVMMHNYASSHFGTVTTAHLRCFYMLSVGSSLGLRTDL